MVVMPMKRSMLLVLILSLTKNSRIVYSFTSQVTHTSITRRTKCISDEPEKWRWRELSMTATTTEIPSGSSKVKISGSMFQKVAKLREQNASGSTINKDFGVKFDDETAFRTPSSQVSSSAFIQELKDATSLLNFIENAEKDCLCIILYHASWCGVCRRVLPRYKKMSSIFLSDTPNISFARLEATSSNVGKKKRKSSLAASSSEEDKGMKKKTNNNISLCKSLGVTKFPFVQIYRNMECVASFSPGPVHNFHKKVGDTIRMKVDMTPEDWKKFRTEFRNEIEETVLALNDVRMSALLEDGGGVLVVD